MSLTRRVSWIALPAIFVACSPPGWDAEVCAGTNLELIDQAIAEAYTIEAYMDEQLDRRFDSSYPSYGQILETLVDYRSRDAIYCGTPASDQMAAQNHGELFVVKSTGHHWVESLELWQRGGTYADLDVSEIEQRVEQSSDYEFWDFRREAEAHATAPAYPLRLLSHEAAHWTIKDCCAHSPGVPMTERGGCDFVDTVGWLAPYGLLWERWRPERLWLEQLYLASH